MGMTKTDEGPRVTTSPGPLFGKPFSATRPITWDQACSALVSSVASFDSGNCWTLCRVQGNWAEFYFQGSWYMISVSHVAARPPLRPTVRLLRAECAEQVRQSLSSLPQMTFRERGCIGGFFRPHINRPCPTSDVRNEAGSGFHYARGSDSHKSRTFIQCGENPVQFERHFAKPADVRANPSAALAPGNLGRRLVNIPVLEGWSAASIAAALEQFPVHVDNLR